jgi:hypothetical protein
MTRRARPEQQVQKSVLGNLAWRAVPETWWCHYPAGGWRSPIEAAIFKSLGVIGGIPDILIVHRGQLYALELKAAGGRLTTIQTDTQAAMTHAGAIVATAHGVDEALGQLTLWGLLRPEAATQTARAFARLAHDVTKRIPARGRS